MEETKNAEEGGNTEEAKSAGAETATEEPPAKKQKVEESSEPMEAEGAAPTTEKTESSATARFVDFFRSFHCKFLTHFHQSTARPHNSKHTNMLAKVNQKHQ